jgi:hypothetical protein
MLYTVIRASIKFNLILRPRVFHLRSLTSGYLKLSSVQGGRPLPEAGLKPELPGDDIMSLHVN